MTRTWENVRQYAESRGIPPVTLVIPKKDNPIRVKMLTQEQFHQKKYELYYDCGKLCSYKFLRHGGCSYLFGKEPRNLEATEGFMIATWGLDDMVTQMSVTPDYYDLLYQTYG